MAWEQNLIAIMVAPVGAMPASLAADWARIDHAARAHRLTPLLHRRVADLGIDAPAALRRTWALDYLRAQQRAAAIAATVAQITARLDAADIVHAFLKGVHLAWSAYPEPALRTMRDIDLLIAAEDVVAARDLLLANGFTPAPFGDKSDDYALAEAKHLAPLIAPETDITVELHHMLTDPAAELGAAVRFDDTAALLARRQRIRISDVDAAVLPTDELLLHIIYHTAYDHFFNNGPQIIADACFLISTHAIDWPQFWTKAEARSMAAGAALILGLCRRTAGTAVDIPPVWTADDAAIDHAARVMMRDNYADRVARSVTDLAGQTSPRAILNALLRKFASQRVIAQNNAHLAAPSDARDGGRSRLSAIGDVLRHAIRHQRRDASLRRLLKDR
jgi:hypothetical protein